MMGNRQEAKRRKRRAEQAERRASWFGWRKEPSAEPTNDAAAMLTIRPVAARGEPPEDVAVFDSGVRRSLPAELQQEATLVSEALELAAQGRLFAAVDRLAGIGRRSPFSQWRLFVRGLRPFQQGNLKLAREAWDRLDASRRPARIARVLTEAWGENGGSAAARPTKPAGAAEAPWSSPVVARSLLHRHSMWEAATAIAAVRHRDPKTTFSAPQVEKTIAFVKQFHAIDPDFTAAFAGACRQLAAQQPEPERFVSLASGTGGPPDDPECHREIFVYLQQFFGASADGVRLGRKYIDKELPKLTCLPAGLRKAIASEMLVTMAEHLATDNECEYLAELGGSLRKQAEQLVGEAVERCGDNRRAHRARLQLIKGRADEPGSRQKRAAEELRQASIAYVMRFPDDHDRLMDLIEQMIDEETFRAAEPLVQLLVNQRCSEPRAGLLPWRFAITQLAFLAKTAAPAAELQPVWQAAKRSWPAVVSRDWREMLEAAVPLRDGQADALPAFEQAVASAGGNTHPLLVDAMTFEALRIAGAPLGMQAGSRKRLSRASDADAVDMPLEPLVATASFLRTLERCGLNVVSDDHPASSFGKRFCKRLKLNEKWKLGATGGGLPTDDDRFWAAFEWAAVHDFFGVISANREPQAIGQLADRFPQAAAEVLSWRARVKPESLLTARSRKRIQMLEKATDLDDASERGRRLNAIIKTVHRALEEELRKRPFTGSRRRSSPSTFSRRKAEHSDRMGMPPLLQLLLDRGGMPALTEALQIATQGDGTSEVQGLMDLAKRLGLSQRDVSSALLAEMSFRGEITMEEDDDG